MTLDNVSLHAVKGHFCSLLVSNIIWLSSFRGLPFACLPWLLETSLPFLERDRCFFLALGSAKGACLVACDSKVFRKGYSLLRSERALYLYFLSSVWRAMDLRSRVVGWFRITLRCSYPVWESKPMTQMPLERTSLFLANRMGYVYIGLYLLGGFGWVLHISCTWVCTSSVVITV